MRFWDQRRVDVAAGIELFHGLSFAEAFHFIDKKMSELDWGQELVWVIKEDGCWSHGDIMTADIWQALCEDAPTFKLYLECVAGKDGVREDV